MPNVCVGTQNGQGLPSVIVSLKILTKIFRENRRFLDFVRKKTIFRHNYLTLKP